MGETKHTPEEKRLRAISSRRPRCEDTASESPTYRGIIIDVKVLSRRGIDKDDRILPI